LRPVLERQIARALNLQEEQVLGPHPGQGFGRRRGLDLGARRQGLAPTPTGGGGQDRHVELRVPRMAGGIFRREIGGQQPGPPSGVSAATTVKPVSKKLRAAAGVTGREVWRCAWPGRTGRGRRRHGRRVQPSVIGVERRQMILAGPAGQGRGLQTARRRRGDAASVAVGWEGPGPLSGKGPGVTAAGAARAGGQNRPEQRGAKPRIRTARARSRIRPWRVRCGPAPSWDRWRPGSARRSRVRRHGAPRPAASAAASAVTVLTQLGQEADLGDGAVVLGRGQFQIGAGRVDEFGHHGLGHWLRAAAMPVSNEAMTWAVSNGFSVSRSPAA
jgi:hypothetical protein